MRKLCYYFVRQKSPNFSNFQEQVLLYLLERPGLNLPCNDFVAIVIAKNRTCFSCFQIVSQLITTELNETLLTCSVMVFSGN